MGTLALVFGPRLAIHGDERVSATSLTASVLAPTTADDAAVAPARTETHHNASVYFALLAGAAVLITVTPYARVAVPLLCSRCTSVGVLPRRRAPPRLPV